MGKSLSPARPGKGQAIKGASGKSSGGFARPGGNQSISGSGGGKGDIARPGGNQKI